MHVKFFALTFFGALATAATLPKANRLLDNEIQGVCDDDRVPRCCAQTSEESQCEDGT